MNPDAQTLWKAPRWALEDRGIEMPAWAYT